MATAINPFHSSSNSLMPQFDEDQWGTWFSVWYTEKVGEVYNLVTVDLASASVTQLMSRITLTVIFLAVLLLALVIAMAIPLSKRITRPLKELTRGIEELQRGNYDYAVPVLHEDELGELSRQFNRMIAVQKEQMNLKNTLEKLLSKELADLAGHEALALGGESCECTLLFTDFSGFSVVAQELSAAQTVKLLNDYFELMVPIIKQHGGFPDKYIGDGILAIFGAPLKLEQHASQALRCAIQLQRNLREFNAGRLARGEKILQMRVGISTGEVIVGAIGCGEKLEYTSVGETTNLANRMQGISPVGQVMLAESTYRKLDLGEFRDVAIDSMPRMVEIKGYAHPVAAYCVHLDGETG